MDSVLPHRQLIICLKDWRLGVEGVLPHRQLIIGGIRDILKTERVLPHRQLMTVWNNLYSNGGISKIYKVILSIC